MSARTARTLRFYLQAGLVLGALALLALGRPGTARAQPATLEGRVVNGETGRPLPGASVFLDGTRRGGATDTTGRFRLAKIPAGGYKVVASMVGFETQVKQVVLTKQQAAPRLRFELRPAVLERPGVAVTGSRDQWLKRLARFKPVLLGESQNADACEFLNPEVLSFEVDEQGAFHAHAEKPLRVRNEALGYEVTYHLSKFKIKGETTWRLGQVQFEALAPEDAAQRRRWKAERRRAYDGSFMHFVRTLARGQDLAKQGFLVARANEQVRGSDMFEEDVGSSAAITQAAPRPPLMYITPGGGYDYLKVAYTGEREEQAYVEASGRRAATNQQVSWISFPRGDKALVDRTSGTTLVPHVPVKHGYWGFLRLADALPASYRPGDPVRAPSSNAPSSNALAALKKKLNPPSLSSAYMAATRLQAMLQDSTRRAATPASMRAYRTVVGGLDAGLSEAQRVAVAPHVARLGLLLPEGLKKEVLAAGQWGEDPGAWRFAEGAGAQLLTWWRAQDPLPATPKNERLAEHLERVATALERYGHEESATGLDERGETYVKYGAPARRRTVEWRDPGRIDWRTGPLGSVTIPSLRRLFMRNELLSVADFPAPNEVWFYDQVDADAYYIFVEPNGQGGHYRAGEVKDLLPPKLQTASFGKFRRENNGFSRMTANWNEDTRLAFAAFQVRRAIYEQLDSEHSDFSARLSSMLSAAGRGSSYKPSLNTYAMRRATQDPVQDWRAEQRREELLPTQRSALLDGVAPLEVAYRTARFLDLEAGTTTAEVYWAPKPGALGFEDEEAQEALAAMGYPAPRRYVLSGHARAYDRAYRSQAAAVERKALAESEVGPARTAPTQRFEVAGLSGLFHLALQFEQHVAEEGGGEGDAP